MSLSAKRSAYSDERFEPVRNLTAPVIKLIRRCPSCQTGVAPDHESRLDILGRRAGPGVDGHRSSLSSGSFDGAHDLGDCRYGAARR